MLDDGYFERLSSRLRIKTFSERLKEMCEDGLYPELSFEEKMAMLIDAEVEARDNKRITKFNKQARFAYPQACMEDIIYLPERSLDKDRMARLASCKYIKDNDHVIVISESGCGKSFVVQALGNAACRNLHSVRYVRHADLCMELNIARGNGAGAYYDAMQTFQKVKLLVIDDFFTSPVSELNIIDTFEIIEGRVDKGSMVLASIIEPEEWHLRIPTKTMADSLIDRIVHRAKYIDLRGPNMREHLAASKR